MKKLILFIVGLVCVAVACSCSQVPSKISSLSIGDTVPDIVFRHMLNYKDSTARLSDFAGKPIILDFFATWCGSCIAALPKLDSLQKKFSDSIQVLVVDFEPTEKVAKFLKNNPTGKKISLPFIAEDSILSNLFPHRLIPHEVWIDEKRQVEAITRASYVTANNLRDLLNKKQLHLPLKRDVMDFNINKPLFANGNGGRSDRILYRSTLCKYIDGLGVKQGIQKDSFTMRVFDINRPILSLYSTAMNGIGNRVILEVKNRTHYINDGFEAWDVWIEENGYGYEIIVPAHTPLPTIHKLMLQDLNRYLNLNGYQEKRLVACWALIIKGKTDSLFRTQGGKPEAKYGKGIQDNIFHNQPVSILISAMNSQVQAHSLVPIVIDETHYTGNIDLELHVKDIHNIPAVREALQHYGLDLIPVKRELEMFVLTEKDYKIPTPHQ